MGDTDIRNVKLSTVASGYPLYDEISVPFIPHDTDITAGWGFELWFREKLGEYMSINAFTREGMEKVAEFNDITLPDSFFDDFEDNKEQCFIKLSDIVHGMGNYKNIHLNFIEGMHRQMAWTHAIYGAAFHPDGLIQPNTLSVRDFEDAEFKIKRFRDNSVQENDQTLRRELRKRFFEDDNDQFMYVTLSIYYVNERDVDGQFLSDAFVQMSKLHSESKRDSNTRCPWQTLGVEAEKFVNSFANEPHTIIYRPDFNLTKKDPTDKFKYPKHTKETESSVEGNMKKIKSSDDNDIVESLYPTSHILATEEFTAYKMNPYSKQAREKLISLLSTKTKKNVYNITSEHEIKLLKPSANVRDISYPFYPSYKSMAEDVGAEFGHNTRMNPMMANNIIHFPLVVTILWEAIKGLSRNATLQDPARLHTIDYYLRFHNDPDENQTNLNLHGAYGQIYSLSQATNMFSSGAEILGAAHTICQMWNIFVAVETESCLDKNSEDRKQAFRKAGGILKRTFTNIGDTVQSANHMDVAVILGEYISPISMLQNENLYLTNYPLVHEYSICFLSRQPIRSSYYGE